MFKKWEYLLISILIPNRSKTFNLQILGNMSQFNTIFPHPPRLFQVFQFGFEYILKNEFIPNKVVIVLWMTEIGIYLGNNGFNFMVIRSSS